MRFSLIPVTATDEGFSSVIVPRAKRFAAKPEQGAVVLKTIAAIVADAVIPAMITSGQPPLAMSSRAPCPSRPRPWACKPDPSPYVNSIGTEFGNPKIRLISIDHPSR